MSLSPEVHKRVLLAKYMHQQATETAGNADELSAFSALLVLHDSTELMMLAVLDQVGAKYDKRREFMDFWKEMESIGLKTPGFRPPVNKLNEMRRLAKHHGIMPNIGQVRDLVSVLKSFFEHACTEYLRVDFNSVSLVDLIEDPDCNALVKSAEACLHTRKRKEAFLNLKFAFLKIADKNTKAMPAFTLPREAPEFSELQNPLNRYLPSLHEAVCCMGDTLNVMMLKADPQRYWYFLKSTPPADPRMGSEIHARILRTWECPSDSAFETCLHFVIDYYLRSASAFHAPVSDLPSGLRPQLVESSHKL